MPDINLELYFLYRAPALIMAALDKEPLSKGGQRKQGYRPFIYLIEASRAYVAQKMN